MQKFDASNSPEFVKEDPNMPNKTQGDLSTVPGLIPTPQNQQQAPAYSPNDAIHRQRLYSQDA